MNEHRSGEMPRRQRRRVAIVEDHLLQRQRTEELVSAQPGLVVTWSGESLPEFTDWLLSVDANHHPHLLLLDLHVDRGDHADPDTVRRLVHSGIRVLAISAMASPSLIRQVLRAGVAGVLGKRDSERAIMNAIWTVADGGTWITPELASVMAGDATRPRLSDQEERALVLYASGLTLDAVAEARGVQSGTAKKYLTRVKEKYAAVGRPVRTKVDLSTVAQQDGHLDPIAPDIWPEPGSGRSH